MIKRNEYKVKIEKSIKMLPNNCRNDENGRAKSINQNTLFSVQQTLKEEVDKFEEEYPLFFDNSKQLIETINKLEEINLNQIEINQEGENQIIELKKKKVDLETEKETKMNVLISDKNLLMTQIKSSESEILKSELMNTGFVDKSFNGNFDDIKVSLFAIYSAFKSYFDKNITFESQKDFDKKKNLINCLAQIEFIIYKFSIAIKKENPLTVFKLV